MPDTGRAQRAFHAMLALTTIATLVALVVRIVSTVKFGTMVPAPIDGPGVYAMWKVQHGYPAYEWPTRGFFALTLYNFLFYQSYARLLAMLGVPAMWLPVGAKLLTVPIAAAGAVLQYVTTAGLLKRRDIEPPKAVLAALAFCIWFGVGLMGRWAVLARPDVAACLFALAGFAVCVSVVDGRPPARLLVAGVLFYVAWAFKQSAFATLAGACLYFVAVRRSVRDAALVAGPFALLAAATLLIGGDAYRQNVLVAPRVAGQPGWWPSWYWYRTVLLTNLPVWAGVAIVLWRALVARREADGWPVGRDVLALFVSTLAAGFVVGVVLLARSGSTINHIFDLWVVSALLASVAYLTLAAAPRPASSSAARTHAVAAVLMAMPLAFTVGYLMESDRITRIVGLGVHAGRPALGSVKEYAARIALRDRLRALPRPVYVDDEILAQPWYANDDRYPAVVIDHVFYDSALGKGLIEDGGVAGLIERRYFGTVIAFVPPFSLLRAARDAGYVEVDRYRGDAGYRGRDDLEVVVLVRSATPPVTPDQIRRPTRRRTP